MLELVPEDRLKKEIVLNIKNDSLKQQVLKKFTQIHILEKLQKDQNLIKCYRIYRMEILLLLQN